MVSNPAGPKLLDRHSPALPEPAAEVQNQTFLPNELDLAVRVVTSLRGVVSWGGADLELFWSVFLRQRGSR